MSAREKQAENMAKTILKHGKDIHFTSDTYKPNTTLIDGSYSLLVQHYVNKHGGSIIDSMAIRYNKNVDVIVRVHETDEITADNNSNIIIFDPWRTYPKASNVVYYGK